MSISVETMTLVLRLLSISTLLKLHATQSTICVWNSISDWDELNGEYILQSGTYNSRSYWKQAPTTSSCPQTPYYLYAAYDNGWYWWFFYQTLQPNYVPQWPDCEIPYTQFPGNPTQCDDGKWSVWDGVSNYDWLPFTVTDGSCPSLECGSIQISNSGYSQCDHTFSADNSNINAFIYSNIHLFFNQYTFKWFCSDNAQTVDDCDGGISDKFFSSNNDGWIDVNVGESFTLELNNGRSAVFECIGASTAPYPTNNPSIQLNTPTNETTGSTSYQIIHPDIIVIIIASLICCICISLCIGCICWKLHLLAPKNPPHNDENVAMAMVELNNVPQSNIVLEKEQIATWLRFDVGLPQYYPHFVNNGFFALKVIKEIENKSQLEDIGITILGHQTRIWSEIKKIPLMDIDKMMNKDACEKYVVAEGEPLRKEDESDNEGPSKTNTTDATLQLATTGNNNDDDTIFATHNFIE